MKLNQANSRVPVGFDLRIACLLWFLFGFFGAHRFYARKGWSAAFQAALPCLAFAVSPSPVAEPIGGLIGLWWFLDLFVIQFGWRKPLPAH